MQNPIFDDINVPPPGGPKKKYNFFSEPGNKLIMLYAKYFNIADEEERNRILIQTQTLCQKRDIEYIRNSFMFVREGFSHFSANSPVKYYNMLLKYLSMLLF